LLKLARQKANVEFHWVVFTGNRTRREEAVSGAERFTNKARLARLELRDFRDGYLPFMGDEVKDVFEQLKTEVSPDIIFTHYRRDAHQDHRLVSDLTWNTWRDHMILEYEIPKWDGDLGQPNFFVPLEEEVRELKVRNIMETFTSQRQRHWFAPETFAGLMRIRGMECNAPSGYAEAFYSRKVLWDPQMN
jgi:LmbE family N-acetylglucosaminyl deacetylase